MSPIEVARVDAPDLQKPLRLLEEWLREGEPVPDGFVAELQNRIEAGELEILAARLQDRPVGVLVLTFRPNVSLGGLFASIEDLYVIPEARRQGTGKALLRSAEQRCKARGIAHLEAQVEETEAGQFYAASDFEEEPDVRVFSRSLPLDDWEQEAKG